jgi:rod shape-determining protein MreC
MINVYGWTIRAPSVFTRLVLAVAVSIGLMVADHKGQHLDRIRSALSILFYPLQAVAGLPSAIGHGVAGLFTSKGSLEEANAKLREEQALMQVRLQQFEALEQENQRLRQMLGSATRVAERALSAELIEISQEPFTRKIVIARGERDGAYIGQPVIDAHGIMGQVTQMYRNQSRVTLITDPGHAVPVLVNRNGLRALVFGTGNPDVLTIPYLTAAADIKEGDLLVSSGMGGTFPPSYPVATVAKIENDPNEAFLKITARPVAKLNHSKQVLLIWPGGTKEVSVKESGPKKEGKAK